MTPDRHGGEAARLVDHLFRRKYSGLVATLTRHLGPANLDLAEDVVQEALLRALKKWSFTGIPESPSGWLLTVARNLAIDRLRKEKLGRERESEILDQLTGALSEDASPGYRHELSDDMLRMMFACCHPTIPDDAQAALILRELCGLSTGEIAAAYLEKEATVAQRIVRAKQRFKSGVASLDLPSPDELPARREAVLNALYLLFSEGYAAHSGEQLSRDDLCTEAIRLLDGLVEHAVGNVAATHALLSFCCFQAARLPARSDAQGRLVELARQDRSLWDRRQIDRGLQELSIASEGEELSRYHLMAGIASAHALATSFDKTDWPTIVSFYDSLVEIDASPVVHLNRAVAVSYAESPDIALQLVDQLAGIPHIQRYYLFHATRADLLNRLGQTDHAAIAASKARSLTGNAREQQFLTEKYLLD